MVGDQATKSEPGLVVRAVRLEHQRHVTADAWRRRAAVAQPGVEFSDEELYSYEPGQAYLAPCLGGDVPLVFEAHSTDYQSRLALRGLVADHFAIFKSDRAHLRLPLGALRSVVHRGRAAGGRRLRRPGGVGCGDADSPRPLEAVIRERSEQRPLTRDGSRAATGPATTGRCPWCSRRCGASWTTTSGERVCRGAGQPVPPVALRVRGPWQRLGGRRGRALSHRRPS